MSSSPASVPATVAGWCFGALWFLVLPAALVAALLAWSDAASAAGGELAEVVRDQRVPVAILMFTLAEMVLYHFRYRLPFASRIVSLGPLGLPPSVRQKFQEAQAFLEQTEQARERPGASRGAPHSSRSAEASSATAATSPEREQLQRTLSLLRGEIERRPPDPAAFHAAYRAAQQLASQQLTGARKSEARRTLESLAVAALIALGLRSFVFEAFRIPSGSMLPTLQIGDHIFVNKLRYGVLLPFADTRLFAQLPPARGDVIVFQFPDEDPLSERQDFVKRVIALPGDTLEAERGHPVINGWPVPYCPAGRYQYGKNDSQSYEWAQLDVEFLGEMAYLTLYAEGGESEHEGPFLVAPGEVYVMGDNRNDSLDSRRWRQGAGGGVPDANLRGRASRVWLPLARLLLPIMGTPRLPDGMSPELYRGVERCLARRPSETWPPPAASALRPRPLG